MPKKSGTAPCGSAEGRARFRTAQAYLESRNQCWMSVIAMSTSMWRLASLCSAASPLQTPSAASGSVAAIAAMIIVVC